MAPFVQNIGVTSALAMNPSFTVGNFVSTIAVSPEVPAQVPGTVYQTANAGSYFVTDKPDVLRTQSALLAADTVNIGSSAIALPELERTDGRVSPKEVAEFERSVRASGITMPNLLRYARKLPLGGPKSLAEYCAASMVGRPIIGGIADPTEEKIRTEFDNMGFFTRGYFRIREFEQSGRIYERLGVQYYKSLLMAIVREEFYHLDEERDITSLMDFATQTKRNEKSHAMELICCAGLSLAGVLLLFACEPSTLPFTLALVPINISPAYLCMLQRYNRARIENTIDLKLGRGPFKIDQ